jgi:WD40 repeat protein
MSLSKNNMLAVMGASNPNMSHASPAGGAGPNYVMFGNNVSSDDLMIYNANNLVYQPPAQAMSSGIVLGNSRGKVSSEPTMVTGMDELPGCYLTSGISGVTWSPDGKYLIAPGSSTYTYYVYAFNEATETLTRVYTALDALNGYMPVAYTANGQYVALQYWSGSVWQVQVFRVTGGTTFTNLGAGANVAPAQTPSALSWHPSGLYLAVGTTSATNTLQVYSFNGTTLSLLAATQLSIPRAGSGAWMVKFSPDGNYLAVGIDIATDGYSTRVYRFNGTSLTLLPNAETPNGYQTSCVSWSSDGRYLAASGYVPPLIVYQFTSETLTPIWSVNGGGGLAYPVAFSPIDNAFAIGCNDAGFDANNRAFHNYIYNFDGIKASYAADTVWWPPNPSIWNAPNYLAWRPDGKYVAVGGNASYDGYQAKVYRVNREVNLKTKMLSGARVQVNGKMMEDSALMYSNLSTYTEQHSGENIYVTRWSKDGKYLLFGGSSNNINVYSFNGQPSLTKVSQTVIGAAPSYIEWHPSGQYLSIGCWTG